MDETWWYPIAKLRALDIEAMSDDLPDLPGHVASDLPTIHSPARTPLECPGDHGPLEHSLSFRRT